MLYVILFMGSKVFQREANKMKYIGLYNFIADAIESLALQKEEIYKKYKALSVSKRKEINQRLAELFPELYFENLRYSEITEDILSDDLIQRLGEFKEACKYKKEYFELIQLLENLDKGLSKRMTIEIEICVEENVTAGLNSNINETGIVILPRCRCGWERKGRGGAYRDELRQFLHHIFYIDKNKLDGLEIQNVFLSGPLTNNEKNRLRIAVSPLSADVKLNTEFEEDKHGVRTFRINGLENIENIAERIELILKKSQEEEQDMILFPEILGTREVVNEIIGKLQRAEIFDIEKKNPLLIFMPSIWENRYNECVVVTGEGEIKCSQRKQNGFLYPSENTNAIEDIVADKKICLMHMNGIGRLAVLLCKDFLTNSYRDIFLSQLETKLMIVPSFSTGEFDFSLIGEQCKADDCCVVWCNTCSVKHLMDKKKQENLDTIAFLQKSGKHRGMKKEEFKREQKCRDGQCKKLCLFTGELIL